MKKLLVVILIVFIASYLYSMDLRQYVTFKPPKEGAQGNSLKFKLIYSGPIEVNFILYYSEDRSRYQVVNFTSGELGSFTAVIPGYYVKTPGLYYYIEAIDKDGNSYPVAGSYKSPLFIKVKKAQLQQLLPTEENFSPFQEEMMLLQAENVVYTASAFAQNILESPASIVSINSDYIHLLGATDFGSILQILPGIDVIHFTPADIQIGVRGFNREITNKLLTMIDGRSIYFDFFGFTAFAAQPISLFDVEKIEIVKGPVSAIYGANAWSGVINIITKDPRKNQGIFINLGDGWIDSGDCKNFSKGFLCLRSNYGNYQYSTYLDKQYLRISMGWDNRGDYEHPDRLSTPELFAKSKNEVESKLGKGNEKLYGNALWGYSFAPKTNLKFQGGFSLIKGNILTELSQYGTEGNVGFFLSEFIYHLFKATFFWNHLNSAADTYFKPDVSNLPSYTGTPLNVEPLIMDKHIINDVFDLTLNQRLILGSHKLRFSAGYRYNRVKAPSFFGNKTEQQNLLNGSFLDEVKFGKRKQWIINVAARFDHHPLTGEHLSPRLALVYKVTENQSLRISASRAFRNPTFIESYMDFTLPAVLAVAPGGKILDPPQFVVVNGKVHVKGNPDLNSEVINGFDFTYQLLKEGIIHFTLDGFYNTFSDLIRYQTTPEGKSFTNLGKGYEFGGEIAVRWKPLKILEIWGNYSFQRVYNTFDDPETLENEKGLDPRFPEHKANIAFFLKMRKVKSTLEFHYESKKGKYFDDDFLPYQLPAVDITQVGTPIVGYVKVSPDSYFEVPPYYIINLNFLYDFSKHVEAGLYVYNLFNYVHKEFPRPEAEELGRIIYAKIRLVF